MKIAYSQLILISLILCFSSTAYALQRLDSCYDILELEHPGINNQKILYVFVDQTMPTTASMHQNLLSLISDWNKSGDRVKIARYSANTQGQYTELVFDAVMDTKPSEEYLYHLRDTDHDNLLQCLEERKTEYQNGFNSAFNMVLGGMNPKLPKTDIFYALSKLSEMVVKDKDTKDKTILLITDGLENSKYATFHKKRSIAPIKPEKELLTLSTKSLLAEWDNANIYVFGLGHVEDKKTYVTPDKLEPLKDFWRLYFTAGNGNVKEMGTPAILVNSIR